MKRIVAAIGPEWRGVALNPVELSDPVAPAERACPEGALVDRGIAERRTHFSAQKYQCEMIDSGFPSGLRSMKPYWKAENADRAARSSFSE